MTAQGFSLERAHLVGVGGAGMSGIARILADRGFAVSGSDARDSPMLAGLAARGVLTAVGHDAANLAAVARRSDRGGGVDRGSTRTTRRCWPRGPARFRWSDGRMRWPP